jgi:hypothetical protein
MDSPFYHIQETAAASQRTKEYYKALDLKRWLVITIITSWLNWNTFSTKSASSQFLENKLSIKKLFY